MPLLALFIFRPFYALVALFFAAFFGYGIYDHISRHWIALLIALATAIAIHFSLGAVRFPTFACPQRLASFAVGFLVTSIGYLSTYAVYEYWTTGHWTVLPAITISTIGAWANASLNFRHSERPDPTG